MRERELDRWRSPDMMLSCFGFSIVCGGVLWAKCVRLMTLVSVAAA